MNLIPQWIDMKNAIFHLKTTAHKSELETALEGASMSNKTVIIAVINKAYAENNSMLDIFLNSFLSGENTTFLLDHLLLAAVDQTSFDRCKFLRLHCHKLETDGVDFSGEKIYMSTEFIRMMWRRTKLLADVLRLGYNFIFTDTDVMWLRNPFLRLGNEGEDLQISCDRFNRRPWDIRNPINTGFYYVRSNNKTIALFDRWFGSRNESLAVKEQDVLNAMVVQGVLGQLGLKVRFLDTLYFGGFCQSGRNFNDIVTLHANCCRTIMAKMKDLRGFLAAWRNFKSSRSLNETTMAVRWPNYDACAASWKHDPIQN
ncbi:hypothetical protein ACLOJK_030420 [Asimina triloba]